MASSGSTKSSQAPVGCWNFEIKEAMHGEPARLLLSDDPVSFFKVVEWEMNLYFKFDKKRYGKQYQDTAKALWSHFVYAPPPAERVPDGTMQARIDELEKEIALLRASASSEAEKKPSGQPSGVQLGGSLPPPSTYAEAVRREFNRSKHAEARADKLNRAKMAAVSRDAAVIRNKRRNGPSVRSLRRVIFRSMFARTSKGLLGKRKQRTSLLL